LGTSGAAGPVGTVGAPGVIGTGGAPGTAGPLGTPGATGPTGASGTFGEYCKMLCFINILVLLNDNILTIMLTIYIQFAS